MNIVDSISRGRRALIVWATITVLLLGLFALVRTNATGNVTEDIDDAQQRGVAHAAVIAGAVEARPGSDAVRFNRRSLATLVQAEIFDDPTVARVRLYGLDGLLLFASDQDVRPGDVQVQSEDPGVAAAAAGDPYRSIVTNDFTWSTVGGPTTSTELLQTFEPLRDVDRIGPAGVVQVDFFMDDLRAAALSSADRLLSVIAVLALLSLAAAVWTLRRPAVAPAVGVTQDADVDGADTSAPAAAPKAAARNAATEAEAASLRSTLEIAERHRAEADERVRTVQGEITAVRATSEIAEQRIRTLETELEDARVRQAELEERARAAGASEEAAAQETAAETEDLRRRLADMESRTRAAEEAVASARAEATAARREADELRLAATTSVQDTTEQETAAETGELRRRLADMESRTQAAEEAVASAQAEAMAARKEADELRRAAMSVRDTPAPSVRSAEADADALRRLEERIAAAEARAREAEEKIDDLATEISPEANDLRARLARTAARKRLGPSSGTEG